ncbi:site-specific integrase [Thalassoglobus sp. JC818]|uniref:site-specific integrase n=1 Tax=Thalassoglobus sp. JC818 TaxID=3232136 RepID=UPI00345A8375
MAFGEKSGSPNCCGNSQPLPFSRRTAATIDPGIDQHGRQLTISLRNDVEDDIQAQQVSTNSEKVQSFFDKFTRDRVRDGESLVAVVEVSGFNDWLIRMLKNYRCRKVFLIQLEERKKRMNAKRQRHHHSKLSQTRLSTDRVSRVIAMIGKEAGVLVQRADSGKREKFASAHDLRKGCALRLINAGASAETLKIVMRHKDFATTEKHYGAFRSAQSAATELNEKLSTLESTPLVGGIEKAPQLSAEELLKLKSLLNSL